MEHVGLFCRRRDICNDTIKTSVLTQATIQSWGMVKMFNILFVIREMLTLLVVLSRDVRHWIERLPLLLLRWECYRNNPSADTNHV
jgi:hypothetical protein